MEGNLYNYRNNHIKVQKYMIICWIIKHKNPHRGYTIGIYCYGEDWIKSELASIDTFKEFVRVRANNNKGGLKYDF